MEDNYSQTNQMPTQKNSLTIPIAIIVAGLLVGGAILYSNKSVSSTNGEVTKGDSTETVKNNAVVTPINDGDYVLGDRSADLMFIEYSDMECPFCKTFHNTLHKLMDEYGKTGKMAWAYRHYPIDQLHPKARKEAEATECAGELGGNQKFWQYLDKIILITPSNNGLDPAKLNSTATELGLDSQKFTACLQSGKYAEKIENNINQAMKADGNGTPHTTVVLKRPMSDSSRKLLEPTFSGIRDQQGNLLITISPDNASIIMRGSMPYEVIKPTIDELLK